MSLSHQLQKKFLWVSTLLGFLLLTLGLQAEPLHHRLDVELYPSQKLLKAKDTLTFSQGGPRQLRFYLHRNLQISLLSVDDRLTLLRPVTTDRAYAEYELSLGTKDNEVSLQYEGIIDDPVKNDYSRGLIASEGATLFGATYWYPSFLNTQIVFDLTVQTPVAWRAHVQGALQSTQVHEDLRYSRFREIQPQEEIYLVAAAFHLYERVGSTGQRVQVLLRQPEPELAEKFLAAVDEYLRHYSDLIAPYPYESFTVIENFWETGYGMPGFTLLGPKVIRLPFILNSSLPHEVLHNWWGNSVYVDDSRGNWCEGLTTYLADYWQQEKAGNARKYRLEALIAYDDFVRTNPAKDFPLRQFRDRHDPSSQAIGYGKSMMLFHMLEFRYGSSLFHQSLKDFYGQNQFRKASFNDLQKSFERTMGQNLETFFSQWLEVPGAPQLELSDVKVAPLPDGGYQSTYTLKQNPEKLYDLAVPVVWTLENGDVVRQVAHLNGISVTDSWETRARPVRIAIDPDFHVFRTIYQEERPATLSAIFGSPQVHFYQTSNSGDAEKFARVWSQAMDGKSVFHEVKQVLVPEKDGALVLIGDSPVFSEFMTAQLQDQKFTLSEEAISINGQVFDLKQTSTVLVTRLKENPKQTVVWVRWSADNNPEEWATRLTHYGSFGILVFKGRPAILKSSWPVSRSPLQRSL